MRQFICIAIFVLFFEGCSHRPELEMLGHEPDTEAVGVFHEVQAGQTLAAICRAYGADLQEVIELNGIEQPDNISVGQRIFVPDIENILTIVSETNSATAPPTVAQQFPPGRFIWPVDGVITSKFGIRGGRRHDGIDIAAPPGTTIRAAATGRVLFAGEQRGYGKLIIIRHSDNFITIYAHNQENLVKEDDEVCQGRTVGRVGTTGRTTGPHLHFEIRVGTRPRNPLFFLPRPK